MDCSSFRNGETTAPTRPMRASGLPLGESIRQPIEVRS